MKPLTAKQNRKLRKKIIRVAEGYLELITIFDDRWPVDQQLAESLADRTIDKLDETEDLEAAMSEKVRNRHIAHVSVLKGQACRIAKRYPEAIRFFELALDLDNDKFETLLAIAWCYKRNDQLADAIKALEHAVRLDGDCPLAQYNLACYLALNQDADRCLEHLARAFELDATYCERALSETDFDSIRDNAAFVDLMINPLKRTNQ